MSDGIDAGAAPAGIETPPAGNAAAPAQPEWMGGLPDDLKSDATLARFADVSALARGALDLKRQASSRVVLPGEGADDAAWGGFFDQIGRPKEASAYDIPVPEGDDGKLADAFRAEAHKVGLLPQQAKALAEWNNKQQADALAAFTAASTAELEAFKSATPDYDAKLARAKDLVKTLGVTPEIADALDVKLGTANLMKLFFGLADRAGEAPRVDGGVAPIGTPAEPAKVLDAKMQDAGWREKVKIAGSPERLEYDRLVAAARGQGARS